MNQENQQEIAGPRGFRAIFLFIAGNQLRDLADQQYLKQMAGGAGVKIQIVIKE